ncbi:MAG: DUF4965 domain-containing protein [Clostridia bacterium]|nr:DUF4965 domain-containing protein [Clostridia bacterium]
MEFRPAAIPLITVDPYFSVWSFGDRLYDDVTRHWTGRRDSMVGLVRIDGKTFRFMGRCSRFLREYWAEPLPLEQKSVDVYPTKSVYVFENGTVRLNLTFLSSLFMDELHLLSRPASYICYSIDILDGKEHDIAVYMDFSGELCVEDGKQGIMFGRSGRSVYAGNAVQDPLHRKGDDVRIDWGYLHVAHPGAFPALAGSRIRFIDGLVPEAADTACEYFVPDDETSGWNREPVIALISDKLTDSVCLAYDDILSIEYYGEKRPAFYLEKYGSFDGMLESAIGDIEYVKRKSDEFDAELLRETEAVSPEYARICALAYRQAIAAHKLTTDPEGNILFLSKECFSNGCIATLDVTYPSIPLFIWGNPELVKGMLRPIIAQVRKGLWHEDYTPHDCGTFPLCNGNVYGEGMPVEECGNMLICTAAVCAAEGSGSFAYENRDLLDKWAEYLIVNGYDPADQLCTDDFAGHLSRNCNLSLKAIVALAAYGKVTGSKRYSRIAKEFAERWVKDASNGSASRLAFDREDSWSIKYNMVWDRILGLGLFPRDVYARETASYLNRMERYGMPLDCRDTYTKLDWVVQTAVMTDDVSYRNAVFECVTRFISETRQRVPMTDWYDAVTGERVSFQNRSVVGALFICLLEYRLKR